MVLIRLFMALVLVGVLLLGTFPRSSSAAAPPLKVGISLWTGWCGSKAPRRDRS